MDKGVLAESEARKAGCPCCAFDPFLPPSLLENTSPSPETDSKESLETEHGLPLSPIDAANIIAGSRFSEQEFVTIVDTHGHAHLERDKDEAYTVEKPTTSNLGTIKFKSITCAVEPSDWIAALEFASRSKDILPALGVHPWYLEGLPNDWLNVLEKHLVDHPSAIVGEIGLCKMARFVRQHPQGKAVALAMQRDVFKDQMVLAARLKRPVTVHCVNQHGVFVSVIRELWDENKDKEHPLPPAIGMHSFTGTAHHVKELLKLEEEMRSNRKSPLFYFGFSHVVNFAMCTSDKSRRRGSEAVCAVPPNRLLAESDVHASDDLLVGTAAAIAYIAWARNSGISVIARLTSRNAMQFLASTERDETE